jgi:hypothetical protein
MLQPFRILCDLVSLWHFPGQKQPETRKYHQISGNQPVRRVNLTNSVT